MLEVDHISLYFDARGGFSAGRSPLSLQLLVVKGRSGTLRLKEAGALPLPYSSTTWALGYLLAVPKYPSQPL